MLSPVKESDSNCGNMPSISCSCSSWRCAHWLIPCGQEALSAAHPALQPQLGQPSSGDAGVSSDGIPLWLASGPLSSRLFSTQHNCFPVRLERWSLFFPCALTDHLSIKKRGLKSTCSPPAAGVQVISNFLAKTTWAQAVSPEEHCWKITLSVSFSTPFMSFFSISVSYCKGTEAAASIIFIFSSSAMR